MKIANWIGPAGGGGESVIADDFEAIPIGESALSGNTKYNLIYAQLTATATGVAGLRGTAIRFATDGVTAGTAGEIQLNTPLQHVTIRFYIRPGTLPPSNTSIFILDNASATTLAGLQLSTTGRLRIRNGVTLTATSTTTIAQNQWTRIEWSYNGVAGQQSVRIFTGANLEGTVADEQITNQGAVADRVSRIIMGIPVATPSVTVDFDDLAIDTDKWVDSK